MCMMNAKEKEVAKLIKAQISKDFNARRQAAETLEKIRNEDWESCVKAAEILTESENVKDKDALIFFAHQLYLEAKELSHQGSGEDIEIRRNEIAMYDKVLAINPKHSSCLNNQGITYMELGEWEKALECFEKGLAGEPGYNPDFPSASSYYADMLERIRGNKEIAIRNLRQKIEIVTIEIDPEEIEKEDKKQQSIAGRLGDVFRRKGKTGSNK